MKKLLLSILGLSALGASAQVVNLGSATNMLTLLNANMHTLSVSDACSSVVFIHRSDPSIFPSENPAHYRYDISTNNGTTFEINKGPLNPNANNTFVSCRYPQVIIDNPSNATAPSSVYFQYLGTYHNSGDWDGITTGSGRMDNSNYTETNTTINNGDCSTVTSMCKGAANTFWATTYAIDNANNLLGELVLLKGTKSGNNVTWTTHKLFNPAWDQHSGDIKAGTANVAFDPTGQFGWISFLGDIRVDIDPNKDEVYDANFYRTVDGGATWTGPYAVNLNDFALMQSVYPTPTTGTQTIHAISAAFESDLAVDIDGQPHLFFTLGYGSSESEIAAGNGYSVRASNMFDMTYDVNIDRFVMNFIAPCHQLRADSIGFTENTSGATVENKEDQRPQVSTTPDGQIVFFSWTDNMEQNIGGIDTVIESATSRYLYVKALAPTANGAVSSLSRNLSIEPDYATMGDKAYFFSVAPTVQRKTNSSVIPFVYGILNPADKKIESKSTFAYLQNVEILDDSLRWATQSDTLGFEILPTSPAAVHNVADNQISIYPNPATTHFTLANVTGKNNVVRIHNLQGAIVSTTKFGASLVKVISTKELVPGTYLVEVESDGKLVSQMKLIKQ